MKSTTIGLYSDTHVKAHRKNSRFYDDHIAPAFQKFYRECAERKAKIKIHLGDFYHLKDVVSTEVLDKTFSMEYEASENFEQSIYLVGNHDSYMKRDHSIHLLKTFRPFAKVVDKDYEYVDIDNGQTRLHLCPYTSEDDVVRIVKSVNMGTGKNLFFGHFGLNGFIMQADGYTDQFTSINKHLFSKFDFAFFGHFHFHQRQGNCAYVSSPFQARHGDEEGEHGFVFFDTDKPDKFDFVENEFSPKFITLDLTKKNVEKMLKLEKHFIRINKKSDVDPTVLEKLKYTLQKKNYHVKFVAAEATSALTDDFQIASIQEWQDLVYKDPEEVIEEFVKMNEKKFKHTPEEIMAEMKL